MGKFKIDQIVDTCLIEVPHLCISRLNIYTSPKQLTAANHCASALVNILVMGGSFGGNSS